MTGRVSIGVSGLSDPTPRSGPGPIIGIIGRVLTSLWFGPLTPTPPHAPHHRLASSEKVGDFYGHVPFIIQVQAMVFLLVITVWL